jgi:hypothetical protein
MTRALAFVWIVGCAGPSSEPPGDCNDGSACGTDRVCTRDHQCLPSDQVRAIHVSWTVSGALASATSCAAAPNLLLSLGSRHGPNLGFSPVPCAEGKFTVDRLPTDYDEVELGRPSDRSRQHAAIDAAGNAMLNLPY